MPEKTYSAITTAMPSPPRIHPTRATARSTSRRAIPPVSMSAPASTKSGKASSTNESTWWNICCTVMAKGAGEARTAPTKPAAPTATATGAPTTSSARKRSSDEDHRGPSGRQSWGSANRIIKAPPTGRAAEEPELGHLERVRQLSVRDGRDADASGHQDGAEADDGQGDDALDGTARARFEAVDDEVHPEVEAAADRHRRPQEDDPDEAEARDLVVPLEGRLHHVPAEHAEEHVAHQDDHEDEADHLDEHVTWPRLGPRPPSDRKTPCPPWPRGISTPAAPAPGTHGCPSPR